MANKNQPAHKRLLFSQAKEQEFSKSGENINWQGAFHLANA
jgi:hypothetical protein